MLYKLAINVMTENALHSYGKIFKLLIHPSLQCPKPPKHSVFELSCNYILLGIVPTHCEISF